jgi:hypothetical protein
MYLVSWPHRHSTTTTFVGHILVFLYTWYSWYITVSKLLNFPTVNACIAIAVVAYQAHGHRVAGGDGSLGFDALGPGVPVDLGPGTSGE